MKHREHHRSASLFLSPYLLAGIFVGISMSLLVLLPLLPVVTAKLSASDVHRLRRELSDENIVRTKTEEARTHARGVDVRFTGGFKPEDLFTSAGRTAMGRSGTKTTMYTAILSDARSSAEFSSAIDMTWGSELQDIQFFSLGRDTKKGRIKTRSFPSKVVLEDAEAGDAYGPEHVRQTLAYACEHVIGQYQWYLVVKETTYVNSAALLTVLDKLPSAQPIVLGQAASPSHPEYCSATSGMVINQAALSAMCHNIRHCDVTDDQNPTGRPRAPPVSGVKEQEMLRLMSCLQKTAGVGCLHASLFSENFFQSFDEDFPRDAVLQQTAFVQEVTSSRDLLKIHLGFTHSRIVQTREKVLRLDRELSNNLRSSDSRLKRDEVSREVESSGGVFFLQSLLANSTDESDQANLIDKSGHMYLDNCKVTQIDADENEAYESAQKLAVQAVGYDVGEMDGYAFKTDRPNLGTEFQMFYLEKGKKKNKDEKETRPDKIHHVTVAQPYGEFHFDLKQATRLQTVNIVLNVSSTNEPQFEQFLASVANECRVFEELGGSCQIFLPTREQLDYLLQQFGTSHFHMDTLNLLPGQTSPGHILDKVKSTLKDDALVLWTSPETILGVDFLLRCHLNAHIATKLYFPIAFQKLEPGRTPSAVTTQGGFWHNSAYDVFCAYAYDLKRLDIGVTDGVNAYKQFKQMQYDIKRAPEPDVQRLWDVTWCQEDSVHFEDRCRQELRYTNLQ